MADQIELAPYVPEQEVPVAAPVGLWQGLRTYLEGSVFAAGVSYVGFVVLLFVLLAALLLAPVLAIAFPLALAAHDARTRRAAVHA